MKHLQTPEEKDPRYGQFLPQIHLQLQKPWNRQDEHDDVCGNVDGRNAIAELNRVETLSTLDRPIPVVRDRPTREDDGEKVRRPPQDHEDADADEPIGESLHGKDSMVEVEEREFDARNAKAKHDLEGEIDLTI